MDEHGGLYSSLLRKWSIYCDFLVFTALLPVKIDKTANSSLQTSRMPSQADLPAAFAQTSSKVRTSPNAAANTSAVLA